MRSSRTTRTPDTVAALIASRRRELGWSFARLARTAELQSPAYVFHIENGHKLPSEPVAIRLATALGLDPELLRAWSRARGRTDLESALLAARTLARLLDPAGSGMTFETQGGDPASTAPHEPDARVSVGAAPPGAALIDVPLLPEGFDPADQADALLPALCVLRLDRRLFPPHSAPLRPIAYRLSASAVRRASGIVAPGACVVVARDGEPPALDHLAAVRNRGRVEIVRWDGAALPGRAPAANSDARVADAVVSFDGVVGRVILAFRRWL